MKGDWRREARCYNWKRKTKFFRKQVKVFIDKSQERRKNKLEYTTMIYKEDRQNQTKFFDSKKLADPTEFCLFLSYFLFCLLCLLFRWWTFHASATGFFCTRNIKLDKTNKKKIFSFIVRGRERRVTVMNVGGKTKMQEGVLFQCKMDCFHSNCVDIIFSQHFSNVSRKDHFDRCNAPIWLHRGRNSSAWARKLSSNALWSLTEQTGPSKSKVEHNSIRCRSTKCINTR